MDETMSETIRTGETAMPLDGAGLERETTSECESAEVSSQPEAPRAEAATFRRGAAVFNSLYRRMMDGDY